MAIGASALLGLLYYLAYVEDRMLEDGPGSVTLFGASMPIATAQAVMPRLLDTLLGLTALAFALVAVTVLLASSTQPRFNSRIHRSLPSCFIVCILVLAARGAFSHSPLGTSVIWLVPALALITLALELLSSARLRAHITEPPADHPTGA